MLLTCLALLALLGATDASTVFGLGATVAPLSVEKLRMLPRLSAKSGEHATITDGPNLDERSHRLGPRHDIGIPLSNFEVVICVRVEDPEHINVEEAKGLMTYVEWVLRSKDRFGQRLVALLDSRVVIGAVTKGRSSSWRLNRVIRRLAAHCFLGGLILHLIFIPTEHNPGDHPSRGGPETWPSALRKKRHHGSLRTKDPCVRGLDELSARVTHLRDCGWSDFGSSTSSDDWGRDI